MNFEPPLVVDLDGTLVYTDMLHESIIKAGHADLLNILRIPYLLAKSKAALKRYFADRTHFDPATLPYNHNLLNWLKQQRADGRKIILCTAADHSIASTISDHLNVFDEIIASDGKINLAGKHKAKILLQRFGQGGFDYVGNSQADIAVWQRARQAIVVNASANLIKKVKTFCSVEQIFPLPVVGFSVWRRVLRVHQWLKNLLLFIPLLAAHQLANFDGWGALIIAFFSFSLCASSVYIANDLMDLESDRQHPRKRDRPFAAGQIPVQTGVILAPLLLLSSLLLAFYVGKPFFLCLLSYFGLTSLYSWRLKRIILLDSLILAMLYTLRIVAGNASVNIVLSFWLLTFAVFLFLSLAFVKRYAELQVQLLQGKQKIHGRGYYTSDAPLIQMLGVASGYAAILVLALYLNSEKVMELYNAPKFIWGAVPVVLFWISWVWMQAHRGKMHDDPLIFALKDKVSLLVGAVFAAILIIGAIGLPW